MKKKVTIGLPLPHVSEYGVDVSWETRQCLNALEKFSALAGITTVEKAYRSVNVSKNHIECAANMEGDFLLIVGSDHTFDQDALLKLLEAAHGLEFTTDYSEQDIPEEPVRKIVGAITPFRMPPYRWVAMKFDKWRQNLYPIVPGLDFHPMQTMAGHVIKVDAVGSGVCLYHRSVFETVPYPWFYQTTRNGVMFGPDTRLCIDAADYGIQTWVHFGVTSLHWTYAPVGFEHYIHYLREAPEAWYADANRGAIMTEDAVQELKQFEYEMMKRSPEKLEAQYAEGAGGQAVEPSQQPQELEQEKEGSLCLRNAAQDGLEAVPREGVTDV